LEGIWKYTRAEWGLEQAERYIDLLTAAFQVWLNRRSPLQLCELGAFTMRRATPLIMQILA
jgi:toxin ParE1/3/4